MQREFTAARPDQAWVTDITHLRTCQGWLWLVVVHSGQGSQYASDDWTHFCSTHHLDPSMSRRGHCSDNAVAESFFSSLKKERIKKRIYKTRDPAHADNFDYIEMFYNPTLRHTHLGCVSPGAIESGSK